MRIERILRCLLSIGLLACVCSPLAAQSQVADCVVGIVNAHVITLTELRMVAAFGVYAADGATARIEAPAALLDKMIDQKVVIDLAGERIQVDKVKVDAAFQSLVERLGQEKAKAEMDAFGVTAEDLKTYLEEKITFETIVSGRFAQGASVTLKEIETYYAETYVPAQKTQGLAPRPMVDMLGAIESELKRAKAESQVAQWIKNLRQQAEVEIRPECLKNLKEAL